MAETCAAKDDGKGISRDNVKKTIFSGRIIELYSDDKPYPSALIADVGEDKAFHVVAAVDIENKICYIITVYNPDTVYFKDDLMTRRP